MDDDGRVWTPERRGLALGLVLTITMLAFEALGVSTAMPIVARDLDGVELYGWTFTAALLGSLIGIALAGGRVDRYGPGKPFVAGLLLFTTGLVGAGAAPSMEFLVASRFVQGVGVGAVPAVIYASMARAFGERARARMIALLSSAWVVPGLIGPAISGFVAEEIGWRWVFFGVLPLVPINALLAARPLLQLGPPPNRQQPAAADDRRVVPLAILLAVGAAMAVGGLNAGSLLAIPVVFGGVALSLVPLRRLLPAGTFTARPIIPAAIATRGLTTLAFFTAQAFLPLALTDLRGQRAAFAGLALTFSTLTWTAGAWLQDRLGHVWGRGTMVARGLVILFVGVASTAMVIAPAVPVLVAALTWSIAGLGMGMTYGGLSLIVLSEAPAGQEGRASSAMQLAEQLSVALGTGFAGAAVAAAERAGRLGPGLAVAFGLATAAVALGNVAAQRLRSGSRTDAKQLVPTSLGLVPDSLDN